MDTRPMTSLTSENWKKRGSWSSSNAAQLPRDIKKKRGSAPLISSQLVREYLAQYEDGIEDPIRPPPGFDQLPMPDLSVLSGTNPSFCDPIDRLPALCRSQTGSRKAQSTIQRAAPAEMERIVQKLSPQISTLMVDAYGNYACQTLFQSCTPAQRLQLIRSLQQNLIEIAKDCRGTHSLQVLITLINLQEEEDIIVQTVAPAVMEIAMHPNASHVLQKLIATVKHNSPLILPLLNHLDLLCTDSLGLLVMKVSISSANAEDGESLRSHLIARCVQLMQDPFGNYAIQHMLETWGWERCRQILKQVKGKIPQLSRQKFASNTIERLLEFSTGEDRSEMLSELSDSFKLRELLNNKFSQFVLKKAISLGGEAFKDQLKAGIAAFPPALQSGKRSKWGDLLTSLQ